MDIFSRIHPFTNLESVLNVLNTKQKKDLTVSCYHYADCSDTTHKSRDLTAIVYPYLGFFLLPVTREHVK
jgi:hypothetical protein